MNWILNINKKNKFSYYLYVIMSIIFDSLSFIIPILIGYVVDMVTIKHNYNHLLLIILVIILFSIVITFLDYISLIKLDYTGEKISSSLKEKCYSHINTLDYHFFEHNNKGELMTNFTGDISTIKRHLSFNIRVIGSILLTFICSLVYLLTINIPFTLILLTPGILIGISSFIFTKKAMPKYEELRDLQANSNDYISDNIEGNKVIKSFALESKEIKNMTKINQKYILKDIGVGYFESTFYSIVDFLSYFMNAIFLIIGGYLFIHSKLSIGELVIFNAYLYNLRAPFIRLSYLLNTIERYSIAKKRIKKLLDSKPLVKLNGPKRLKSLKVPIEFKNVKIVYDNKTILDNLNITINPNETIAFIGSTGSGKSSIVNLLLGFITPASGEILINGENYLNYNIKDIRRLVGYVTQNAYLFSDTIYNNIAYGNTKITKKEASKYAKIACCDYIENLPDKLDTIIGEKGVGLSGGEKQRLSLARALAVKPDILLLDEITSALDIETEEKINESINNLDYESTKIIIASKIVSVEKANKIYVLDKGQIVESGTHQELLNKKGYYYELYTIGRGEING